MAFMWLGPNTLKEATMGDWYELPDGSWRYDKDAPAPGQQPATTMLPIVPSLPPQRVEGEDDDLVERTYNGLRDDDLDLQQPPQSPAWTPT